MANTTDERGEPVAFHYFAQLSARLRAHGGDFSVPLSSDLLERMKPLAEHGRIYDPASTTVARRVSWCCHTAADELLYELKIPVPATKAAERGLVTVTQLDALDAAAKTIEGDLVIDDVEYKMGDQTRQRSAEQMFNTRVQLLVHEVATLRELLGYAKAYTQGIQSAAGTVGSTFFCFFSGNRTRDELLDLGKRLVEVHA
jgi:hypothetical protein